MVATQKYDFNLRTGFAGGRGEVRPLEIYDQ